MILQTNNKLRDAAALSLRVRESYERFPYPAVDRRTRLDRHWRLVPIEWIEALIQPEPHTPRRILVAGCGTGDEAFAFARRFRKAQIVGVDFSPRSIRIARELQKSLSRPERIRFFEADLTDANFKKIVGGGFDFISCHGVLSYIPQPGEVLRNLAACLDGTGVLYLGVNGSRHYSETWRRALPMLGVDPTSYEDGPEIRKMLKVCAALYGSLSDWRRMAKPEYIAGDVLAPIISNLPLSQWQMLAREAGLHFVGSRDAHQTLRPLFTDDLYDVLIPRSRAEVHQLAEQIFPTGFHRLIFSLQRPPSPPWRDRIKLESWRIARTPLYVPSSPKTRGSPTSLAKLTLKSPATNAEVVISMPEWAIRVIQQSSRPRLLSEILGERLPKLSTHSLSKHLYLLYLLAAINLSPPD